MNEPIAETEMRVTNALNDPALARALSGSAVISPHIIPAHIIAMLIEAEHAAQALVRAGERAAAAMKELNVQIGAIKKEDDFKPSPIWTGRRR